MLKAEARLDMCQSFCVYLALIHAFPNKQSRFKFALFVIPYEYAVRSRPCFMIGTVMKKDDKTVCSNVN